MPTVTGTKISSLLLLPSAIADGSFFPIVQSGTTYKTRALDILTKVSTDLTLGDFVNDVGFLSSETDPIWTSEKPNYYTSAQVNALPVSTFTNDAVYLTTSAISVAENQVAYGNSSGNIISSPTLTFDGTNLIHTSGYFQQDSVRIDGTTVNNPTGSITLSALSSISLTTSNNVNITGSNGVSILSTAGTLTLSKAGGIDVLLDMSSVTIDRTVSFQDASGTIAYVGDLSSYVPTTRTITLQGTANEVEVSAGAQDLSTDRSWTIGLPNDVTVSGNLTVSGTGSVQLASGTTAQRPGTPANGMLRNNTSTSKLEAYEGGSWKNMITGVSLLNNGEIAVGNASGDIEGFGGFTFISGVFSAPSMRNTAGISSGSGFSSSDSSILFNSGDLTIRSTTAGNIIFNTGGTEKARISSSGQVSLNNTSNQIQLGTTNTTTINATAPVSSVVYTIPDKGGNDTFAFLSDVAGVSDFVVTNEADNRIITSTGSGTGNAEANLTFDGTTLLLTGTETITGQFNIDNIRIDGNTISSTSGDIVFNANIVNSDFNFNWTDNGGSTSPNVFFNNQATVSAGDVYFRITQDAGTSYKRAIWYATPFIVNNGTSNILNVTNSETFVPKLSITNTANQIELGTTNTTTLNSVAPAISRVYTIPDFGSNDTFVGLAATQTLTNKTLTSPTIGGTPSASGATWSNLGIVTTVDVNGGTIDGTTIGGTTPAAGSFTTVVGTSIRADVGNAFAPVDMYSDRVSGNLGGVRWFNASDAEVLSFVSSFDGNLQIFNNSSTLRFSINGTSGAVSTNSGSLSAGATDVSSLIVNGNITVTGTVDGRDIATDGSKLDSITGTKYWSIPGIAFDAVNPDTDQIKKQGATINSSAVTIEADGIILNAPVNLLHGATITSVIVEGSISDETWTLTRTVQGSTTRATMATANINTADTTISAPTIDNNNYVYHLETSSLDTNDIIYSAMITYTI